MVRFKKPFNQMLISNHSGQAVIEYVLILVVTVSLVIAAKGAFGKLDKFLNHYIADYTICLMDYGELPSLGVQDSNQKKHEASGVCDKEFEGFTLANGRPPVGSGGASRSGSANRSQDTKAKGGGGSRGSGSGSGSGSSDQASKSKPGTKRGRNGSDGRKSPYGSGQISRNGSPGTGDAASVENKKSKVIETEQDNDSRGGNGGRQDSRNLVQFQKIKYRAITGAMLEEFEKKERKAVRVPTSTSIPVIGDTGNRFGPYKKAFTPPEPKKIVERADDNSGLGFGGFFRMLIIIAMIVAIVVFFGGQIMNYNNSKD